MSVSTRRLRLGVAAVVTFAAGVIFASGLDLTRFSWAQGGSSAPTALSTASALRIPEGTSTFADIAERVTPAVVSIRVLKTVEPRRGGPRNPMEEFLEQFGQPRQQPEQQGGEGSGFLVTRDGYILTNNHVVEGASTIEVALPDRRRLPAKLIGADPTTDIAVIKIDGRDFPTIPLGDERDVRIGDWALAVGNPLGLDFTVTAGIISAKGRGGAEVLLPNSGNYTVSDFIQTDAAINPGNSGGPLINLAGEVIGVNSAIASRNGLSAGYGFAIPITLARQVMEALIRDGKVRLAVMGVSVAEIDADDAGLNGLDKIAGVKVQSFNPENGPAAQAGIKTGDIILSVGGEPVDRVSALQRVVRGHEVGETVPVEIVRFGQRQTVDVKLADKEELERLASGEAAPNVRRPAQNATPEETASGKLGITVEPVDMDAVRQLGLRIEGGVRVMDVQRSGPASGKLLPQTDILTEITYPGKRRPIRSLDELESFVQTLKAGDYVGLAGIRLLGNGAQTFTVTLRVGGEGE